MDTTLTISQDTLGPAFAAWAEYQQVTRGKSLIRVVQDAMQYLISFAMAEIEASKPSSPAAVESSLMRLSHDASRVTTGRRARLRGNAAGNKYRNTIAARIVFLLNYKDARLKAAFGDDAGAYSAVAQFVGARKYSVRHHKVSGFLPALIQLARRKRGYRSANVGLLEKGPRYRHAPGMIAESISANLAEIVVSAWPSAAQRPGRPAPLGLARLVPDALTARLPQVQALFIRFCQEDGLLTEAAARAGFKVLDFGTNTFGTRAA